MTAEETCRLKIHEYDVQMEHGGIGDINTDVQHDVFVRFAFWCLTFCIQMCSK